jgi:hypothetical protein
LRLSRRDLALYLRDLVLGAVQLARDGDVVGDLGAEVGLHRGDLGRLGSGE